MSASYLINYLSIYVKYGNLVIFRKYILDLKITIVAHCCPLLLLYNIPNLNIGKDSKLSYL